MKFRYNYLENRLWWKLDEEYSYEISEESHFRIPEIGEIGIYGSDGFYLGEKEWIVFTFTSSRLKVTYQKSEKVYQKNLDLPNTEEIIFEFTDSDWDFHIHKNNDYLCLLMRIFLLSQTEKKFRNLFF